MPTPNRQVVLAVRPTAAVDAKTCAVVESELPDLIDGQALVKVSPLSIYPTIRTWMDDAPGYIERSADPGGVVVESRSDRYRVGDVVTGMVGWQEYAVADEAMGAMAKIPEGIDLAVALNVLGITGMTAYFGLLEVGALKEGDVVVVSGAAGATGSMVGQLAKINGAASVVGIAGGPEKCAQLVDELGFDAAIDYRQGKVSAELHRL